MTMEAPSSLIRRDSRSMELGTTVTVWESWEGYYGKKAKVVEYFGEKFFQMDDISCLPHIPCGSRPDDESELADDGVQVLLACTIDPKETNDFQIRG